MKKLTILIDMDDTLEDLLGAWGFLFEYPIWHQCT